MELHVSSESQTVGFGVVKLLLQGQDLNDWPTSARLATRLLFPLESDADALLDAASLTDGARAHDQIRFFLNDRLTRNFRDIVTAWCERTKVNAINVEQSASLDQGSRRFLETLADLYPRITVSLRLGGVQSSAASRYVLSTAEEQVETACRAVREGGDDPREFLLTSIRRYLSVGDAWTALRLLDPLISRRSTDPVIWSCLGLAYTMLGRTLEAEFCYLTWQACPDGAERAFADYALAMLYARHHPDHLRSMKRAEEFLEDGRVHLEALPASSDPELHFYKVFNRNGRALLQFRQGQVDQALAALREGITTLETSSSPRARMHQSVLLYNLAQVLRRTGALQSAVREYERLLLVDPRMPEYHMELAQCFLELGQPAAAVASLETARTLGPSIPEVHALLGFAHLAMGNSADAIRAYAEAHRLDPYDASLAYDYAYALNEAAEGEPLEVLEFVDIANVEDDLARDVATLRAECLAARGDLPGARVQLQEVLARLPYDPDLLDNLQTVEDAMSRAVGSAPA